MTEIIIMQKTVTLEFITDMQEKLEEDFKTDFQVEITAKGGKVHVHFSEK